MRSKTLSRWCRAGARAQIVVAVAVSVALAAAPAAAGQDSKDSKASKESKADKEKRRRLEENRRKRAAAREKRVRERILTARDLAKTIEPWVVNITDCYKTHALRQKRAKGTLHLEVLVEPSGRLRRLDIVAPGVRGKKLRQCIEPLGRKWRFPSRKGFTKATIPFRFLHSKGAGPIQSCWSKRGCPSKHRGKRAATAKKRDSKKDKK